MYATYRCGKIGRATERQTLAYYRELDRQCKNNDSYVTQTIIKKDRATLIANLIYFYLKLQEKTPTERAIPPAALTQGWLTTASVLPGPSKEQQEMDNAKTEKTKREQEAKRKAAAAATQNAGKGLQGGGPQGGAGGGNAPKGGYDVTAGLGGGPKGPKNPKGGNSTETLKRPGEEQDVPPKRPRKDGGGKGGGKGEVVLKPGQLFTQAMREKYVEQYDITMEDLVAKTRDCCFFHICKCAGFTNARGGAVECIAVKNGGECERDPGHKLSDKFFKDHSKTKPW